MKVSLVITNYDGKDILARCLPQVISYAQSGDCIDEVVLVENGSQDGSQDFVLKEFPSVKTVLIDKNRGFAPGANAGFRAVRNQAVLLLSNDMVPGEGCAERLLPHLCDPRVFAVTARQLDGEGNIYLGVNGLSVKWGVPRAHWGFHPQPEQEPQQAVTHFGGGISLYNRDHLLALGGFDEELLVPFYIEDDDLFYRAWKRGFTVVYEPHACVYHYHEHPTAIAHRYDRRMRWRIEQKNRFIYVWKNVHDRKMFAAHLVRTCIQLCLPRWRYHAALADALKHRQRVLQKRREERRASQRTDTEAVKAIQAHIPWAGAI